MTPEQVEACTILKVIVGSRCLGLETPESDVDIMGVCIEPIEEAYGLDLDAPFEQFVRTGGARSLSDRSSPDKAATPDEARDGPDLQIYSLRKFLRLALSGNPTILALLFIPESMLLRCDARGAQLMDLAPFIISRQAGKAFLGYMQAQRMRLAGERGQKRINRPDLVEQYGYDTKYAMHVLRLGIQGVELLNTGRLTLPMLEVDRNYLRGVRSGSLSYQAVLTKAGELEQELKHLIDCSPLREQPDRELVEDWMLTMYFRTWSATRTSRDIREDAERWATKS